MTEQAETKGTRNERETGTQLFSCQIPMDTPTQQEFANLICEILTAAFEQMDVLQAEAARRNSTVPQLLAAATAEAVRERYVLLPR